MGNESESMQKYRQAFQMLNPDANGKVHRDNLKLFLQRTLGSLFEEETAQKVIDHMKPDEDDMISIDGFIDAFSLSHWPPETLAAMHDVLENSPDTVKGLADWKGILTNLGLNINEDEVGNLITQARKCAADLLSLQLKKDQPMDKVEIGEKSSHILKALHEKLDLLDIGGGVMPIKKLDEPSSKSD